MKIISLLENTSQRADMEIEHGLSLYIEALGHRILFDMGQTDMFYRNAEILGVNIGEVDIAVLSHGHYDHGGGLRTFLELNRTASVYVNENAFAPHYNGTKKYIGLDLSLRECERITKVGDELRIDDGIYLFSCNGREKRYELGSFGLTERVGDSYVDDDFRHEQYLLVKEEGHRVLLSGCSHKGILDIVRWFSPDVLIGGFHFSKMPLDDALYNAALELDGYDTEFYTCHCTGSEQFAFMKKHMRRLKYLSCGEKIYI